MRSPRDARAPILAGLVAAAILAASSGTGAQPARPTRPAAPPAPPPAAAPGGGAPGPRDPFEPLVKPVAPGEARRHEISVLKLVGIVWDVRDPQQIRALVETPDGLGYYLRVNEERFGGTVVAIQPDGIRFTVREQIPGAPAQTRTVELKLPKPEAQP